MPSIKDLKKRIVSTKNTQQTTKAMKMVSAAKLRRATDAVQSQRPYAQELARLMVVLKSGSDESAPTESTAKKAASLCVVVSSDRGLCGGYNGSIIKAASQFYQEQTKKGRPVKFAFVGKKAFEILRGRFPIEVTHFEEFGPKIFFKKASTIAKKIQPLFDTGEVDEVVVIFNYFQNAISQVVQQDRVLPVDSSRVQQDSAAASSKVGYTTDATLFVPSRASLLEALSAKYFVIQIYRALLEAQASEHGARMSAMESATKNAGDMIRKLTLLYNKQRQASITKELLEIIAGSESQKN